jgi:predicted dehydrogenase
MERLRILVLGLGFFGKRWVGEISACPECELVGIVAKHPDLLTAVGDEFQIPPERRYGSIRDGLAKTGAQAAVVALPEMLHKEAILQVLSAGLHVITEKPLAMTMAEAGEIVRAARRAPGRVVMVDQNYRWRPHTQALRGALRAGRIGRVASISYEYRQAITRQTTDAWRERMPHPYLHDMVVHHFDLLRAITGLDCQELLAVGVRPSWNWYEGLPGIDVLLGIEDGVRAIYTGTMVARGYATPQDGIITLIGEAGTLRLEADSQVRCYPAKGEVEVIPAQAMPFTDTAYALREFLGAIREGRRPETHLDDNIRSLAMMAAAVRSVETGQRVALAPLLAEGLGMTQ